VISVYGVVGKIVDRPTGSAVQLELLTRDASVVSSRAGAGLTRRWLGDRRVPAGEGARLAKLAGRSRKRSSGQESWMWKRQGRDGAGKAGCWW
jgi:hypothetical protein